MQEDGFRAVAKAENPQGLLAGIGLHGNYSVGRDPWSGNKAERQQGTE